MAETRLLGEYDQLVTSLQTLQELYSADHDKLRADMLRLVADNEDLRQLVEELFRNRLQPQDMAAVVNNEMVANLRSQLEVSMNERSQLCDMLQEAQRQIRQTIPSLLPQNFDGALQSLTTKLESLQLELKMERSTREDEQTHRLRAQTELARMRVVLEEKTTQEEKLKEKLEQLNKQCSGTEEENLVLRATVECVTQSRDALEKALAAADRKVEWLQAACEEARYKVEEAIELAEKSVSERDAILAREQTLLQHLNALESASQRQATTEADIKRANNQLEKTIRSTEKELKTKLEEVDLLKSHCCELEAILANVDDREATLAETREALQRILAENESLSEKLTSAYQKEYEQSEATRCLQLRLDACTCPVLRHKLNFTKAEKKKQISELQRHIETQLKINQRWESEAEKLLQQLQTKSARSAAEIEKLKLRNKKLKSQLKAAEIAAFS